MTALIANARMYDVAPDADAAWRALFEWIADRSGAPLRYVAHPAPASLETLWDRPDLGAVFMCGWPFARRVPQPVLIAAPIPAAARFGGRPVYATDLIVRADSPFKRLGDSFGGRLAYTATHSHSGYNAVRRHLLDHRPPDGRALYREVVGPLVTPRAALQAVLDGAADIAPLDAYAHELMRRQAPELVRDIRVLDTTRLSPIPPLVAHPDVDASVADRLAAAFDAIGRSETAREILNTLALSGFARPAADTYRATEEWARAAADLGRTGLI